MVLQSLYHLRLPRYTSYPTAPHFSKEVDEAVYKRSLVSFVGPSSLYFHIPFCRRLCWFCGCHTKICSLYAPIKRYVQMLIKEVEMVSQQIGRPISVDHIHFGGGSPQILQPEEVGALTMAICRHFTLSPSLDVAIEADPSTLSRETTEAFLEMGLTRVSLGVQDFDPAVQNAIGREQSFETTAQVVDDLKKSGVGAINFDLMYGLPLQTTGSITKTMRRVSSLRPDRIALFGYAHVPWIKKHQRLLEKHPLPDGSLRQKLFEEATDSLKRVGYHPIGIDHFAMEDDPLYLAWKDRLLHRNFQGYTTDDRPLLGFGASAIGKLQDLYVQNVPDIDEYQSLVQGGRLPTQRGTLISGEDEERGLIIEHLMCFFEAECDESRFHQEKLQLASWIEQGFVSWEGGHLRILSKPHLLARVVASAFDQYLSVCDRKHSLTV